MPIPRTGEGPRPLSSAGVPAVTVRGMLAGCASDLAAVVSHRLPWWLSTGQERAVFYTGVSAIGSFLLVAGKGALLLHAPSLFLLANVLFTLGVAAAKTVTVIRHRTRSHDADRSPHPRTAALAGGILLLAALVYVGLCMPLLSGDKATPRFEPATAIVLATIAFTELGIAVTGILRASRRRPVLVITRSINLANALILVTLAQAALLSFTTTQDYATGLGTTATVLGTGAAATGAALIWRLRRRPGTDPRRLDSPHEEDRARACPTRCGSAASEPASSETCSVDVSQRMREAP